MIQNIYAFLLDISGEIQLFTSVLLIISASLTLRTQKKWLDRYNRELDHMRRVDQMYEEVEAMQQEALEKKRKEHIRMMSGKGGE